MFLGHTLEDAFVFYVRGFGVQPKAFSSSVWNLLNGIKVHLELILSTA